MPKTSSPASRENKMTLSFDCTICYQSLAKPGPFLSVSTITNEELGVVYRYVCNGESENNTIMATLCGHIFHKGCLLEWFSTRKYDRVQKCPFCNHETSYDQCRVLHPTVSSPDPVMEPSKIDQETQYSDIPCTSSTYLADDEYSPEEDYIIIQQAAREVQTENYENEMAFQEINSRSLKSCLKSQVKMMEQIKDMNSTLEEVYKEQRFTRDLQLTTLLLALMVAVFIIIPTWISKPAVQESPIVIHPRYAELRYYFNRLVLIFGRLFS